MLVHFPIACWSLATMGDLAYLLLGMQIWWMAGLLMAIGVISAMAAMIAGLIDFAKIEDENPAMHLANWHMRFVMMSWSLYATSLFLRLSNSHFTPPSNFAVALSILGFIVLSVAGWLGAKLVYAHGIGVAKR